jgi:uncharacterized protein (DUF2164 family)
MKKDNLIKISRETRDEMISEIKTYFSRERGEDLGDLAADLVLDFVTEKLAPGFYNQGVADSCRYMEEMIADVSSLRK